MTPGSPTLAALLRKARERGLEADLLDPDHVADRLPVGPVRVDSRLVAPGDVFAALRGTRVDGAGFVADALARGASAIVAEALPGAGAVPCVLAPDVAAAAGFLASAYHGDPSDRLDLVGITGTNGKTSCTWMLESVWKAAGRRPGVIGTIAARCHAFEHPAAMTTPSAVDLQALLASMADAGCDAVAMEASSHALDQGRVAGCRFRAALFTNLTRDHLDYHATEEAYFAAKALLFHRWLPVGGVAVLNAEDTRVATLATTLAGRDVWTTSVSPSVLARARIRQAECSLTGTRAVLDLDGTRVAVHSRLVGAANLANMLSVAALAFGLGVDAEAISAGLSGCLPVSGRMERVHAARGQGAAAGGPACFVDYAHTPDALERSLRALVEHKGSGRVLVVFGCGGDRDRGKRPIMGRLAAELADVVVLTSDNPRSEDPHAILEEVEDGIGARMPRRSAEELAGPQVGGYLVEADRLVAIETAIAIAHDDDVVLVAGKGHEDYQETAGVKRHFDDRQVVGACLARRAARGGSVR